MKEFFSALSPTCAVTCGALQKQRFLTLISILSLRKTL
jgi:hypothetical protein